MAGYGMHSKDKTKPNKMKQSQTKANKIQKENKHRKVFKERSKNDSYNNQVKIQIEKFLYVKFISHCRQETNHNFHGPNCRCESSTPT